MLSSTETLLASIWRQPYKAFSILDQCCAYTVYVTSGTHLALNAGCLALGMHCSTVLSCSGPIVVGQVVKSHSGHEAGTGRLQMSLFGFLGVAVAADTVTR